MLFISKNIKKLQFKNTRIYKIQQTQSYILKIHLKKNTHRTQQINKRYQKIYQNLYTKQKQQKYKYTKHTKNKKHKYIRRTQQTAKKTKNR